MKLFVFAGKGGQMIMMRQEEDILKDENQYKQRLSIALKAAKICVFEVDLQKQLYTFFENAEDIFGVSGESILRDVQKYSQLSPGEYKAAASAYFSHPEDAPVIDKAFRDILRGESTTYTARMKAGQSQFVWCKIDVTPIMEKGIPVKMIGVITDISGIKEKTDELEEKTRMDLFTGLYNKEFCIRSIKAVLENVKESSHAVLLLDIDCFKSFNDTFGHYEGDRAIQTTANLLKRSFRRSDILGRFGGDEFIVFVRDIPDRQWLYNRMKELVDVDCGKRCWTNSVGAAIYPSDGVEFEQLFQKADKALYHSKRKRGACTLFADICD